MTRPPQALSAPATPRRGLALLLAAGLASLAARGAGETVPAAVNYQGKLTDSTGNAVKSGYYEIQFRIWNDATKSDSANYIWGRKFPLHVVTNGLFNVLLTNDGEVPGSPAVNSILDAFAGTDRYLGLTITRNPDGAVGSPVEITPRQKLATAPYAIHAHQATAADHATSADNATQAASASSAVTASNATKFDNLSTSDFVKVKQTAQTITGDLNVTGTFKGGGTLLSGNTVTTDSLTTGGLSASGNATVSKDLAVSGKVTATGSVSANGGLNIAGSVRFGTDAPVIIRRFTLPTQTSSQGPRWHDTKYETKTWSAVFVGVNCTGDFEENDSGPLLQMMLYPNGNGNNGSGTTSWRIYFGVRHADHDLKEISVDVMFIRKELTDDDRPTTHGLAATDQ